MAASYRPTERRQILITRPKPPAKAVEYLFYAFLIYSVLGPMVQLSVPFAGVGILLVLTGACVLGVGLRGKALYRPLILPFATGISFLLVQMFVHGESLKEPLCRAVFTWMLGLTVVQSLSARPGFLHRSALAIFFIGLVTLPYLELSASGLSVQRASIDEVGAGNLANPNGLAEWFGFCAVYFVILGLETRNSIMRIGGWLLAMVCLYVVTLTVSRGALLATALAIAFAIQHLLKRGFVPILLLIVFTWVVFESGLFGEITSRYSARVSEETGRFLVWPLALNRFVEAPAAGVGVSSLPTYVPERDKSYTPHNTFIFLGLASGIVPLSCFIAFCVAMARSRFSRLEVKDAAFRKSLFVFTLIVSMVGDLSFMSPWGLLAFSPGLAAVIASQMRRRKFFEMPYGTSRPLGRHIARTPV